MGVELQNAVASRQKLEGQKQENVGVQQVSDVLRYSEHGLMRVRNLSDYKRERQSTSLLGQCC